MPDLALTLKNSFAGRSLVAARDFLIFNRLSTGLLNAVISGPMGGRINNRNCTVDTNSDLISPWVKALIFWGFYEKSEVNFVIRYLKPETDVIELGGSIGVVSSQIASRLKAGQKLITVEADPRLIASIKKNIELNAPGVASTVLNLAVDYSAGPGGHVNIDFGDSNLSGSVSQNAGKSSTRVPATTLAELRAAHGIGRFALISDIEGAEAGIIDAEVGALQECDLIIIELHDTRLKGKPVSIQDQVDMLVRKHGFKLIDHRKSVYVFVRGQ